MDMIPGTTPLPNPPMAPSFTNHFARYVLLSLRLVAGPAYRLILTEAGLEQYLEQLPPDDAVRTMSDQQVARLVRGIYAHLDAPQAMLVFTHIGEQMAEGMWALPEIRNLAEPLALVPPAEQVAAAWQELNGV